MKCERISFVYKVWGVSKSITRETTLKSAKSFITKNIFY